MSLKFTHPNDQQLAHSHPYHYFITSYKILKLFFDPQNQIISQSYAYSIYKIDGKRSKKTFYNHVNFLRDFGFLFFSHGSSPAWFYTIKEQIERLKNIILVLKGMGQNYTLQQNHPVSAPTQQNFSASSTHSMDFFSEEQLLLNNHPFHQILHNFIIKIPIKLDDIFFNHLNQYDQTFHLVAGNDNFRRYHARLSQTSHHGSWKSYVQIFRTSIQIRLYEVHALDPNIAFDDALDRVMTILRKIEFNLAPTRISYPTISDCKFPTRGGQTYGLEFEFAHYPINEILKERVQFTGLKSHYESIDARGNKIGYDCSPRRDSEGVIRTDPHYEIHGPDSKDISDSIIQDDIYVWNTGNSNELLASKITTIENEIESSKNILTTKIYSKIDEIRTQIRDNYNELDQTDKDLYSNQDQIVDLISDNSKNIDTLVSSTNKLKNDLFLTNKNMDNIAYVVDTLAQIISQKKPSLFSKLKNRIWSLS